MARSPFAPKKFLTLVDFSGGKNDKFSPLLLSDNELVDVQNFTYDQKGTLTKRKGFVKHYATPFGTGPVKGLYNYRKEDGTSRLIIACDGKLLYDKPQFKQLYDLEADWEITGSSRVYIDTTSTPGDIQMQKGIGMPGRIGLGGKRAALGGTNPNLPEAIWTSNPIDISTIQDKTTGTVTESVTLPTGTTRVVETRYSTDAVNWGAWTALGAGNSIVGVGTNTWMEIRTRLDSTSRRRASYQLLQVNFDTTPTVTTLASGLSTSDRWQFATMNDILWMVNGTDTNKKWDGTTFGTQGGTPPTCKYIVVHKNLMFLAGTSATNRSRLYFSLLGDPETWNVLNFIDVGKGDGDSITGLGILNDQLAIFKDHSTWVLQGDAASNFVLRKASEEAGAVVGQSVAPLKQTLVHLARDGVYFFDGVRVALASEKITKTLLGMNQRQLQQAASIAVSLGYTRKYYLALPEGTSTTNTTILVFDSLRAAWSVYRGMPAGEFALWRQFNADTVVFGSATTGQVYDMDTGYNDDGAAIDAFFITKALDFKALDALKLGRRVFVDGAEPTGAATTATVSFFKDLGAESGTQTISFSSALNILRALPGALGIGPIHSLAIKVRHNIVNQGLNVYRVSVEFINKGLRPTG